MYFNFVTLHNRYVKLNTVHFGEHADNFSCANLRRETKHHVYMVNLMKFRLYVPSTLGKVVAIIIISIVLIVVIVFCRTSTSKVVIHFHICPTVIFIPCNQGVRDSIPDGAQVVRNPLEDCRSRLEDIFILGRQWWTTIGSFCPETFRSGLSFRQKTYHHYHH